MPEEPVDRVEALLDEVVDALDLEAEVRSTRPTRRSPPGSRARTSAC